MHSEETYNQGHPGWGHIVGIVNDKTNEPPHFCPDCKLKIIAILDGGENGMG